jgi:hypothetical protein
MLSLLGEAIAHFKKDIGTFSTKAIDQANLAFQFR